jgi:hypothetical protein
MIRMANLWLIARNTDVYKSSKKVHVSGRTGPMVEISSFAIQRLLCQIVAKFAKFAKSIGGLGQIRRFIRCLLSKFRFVSQLVERVVVTCPCLPVIIDDHRLSVVSRFLIHGHTDATIESSARNCSATIGFSQIPVTNTY